MPSAFSATLLLYKAMWLLSTSNSSILLFRRAKLIMKRFFSVNGCSRFMMYELKLFLFPPKSFSDISSTDTKLLP